jgi:hypothetical protein
MGRGLERMLDIQSVRTGLLTSKGDREVFTWSITGTSKAWRIDGPKQRPLQLTSGEDVTSFGAINTKRAFWVACSLRSTTTFGYGRKHAHLSTGISARRGSLGDGPGFDLSIHSCDPTQSDQTLRRNSKGVVMGIECASAR